MDKGKLLAAAVGRKFTFPSELVEFAGVTFEVRTPSISERSRIIEAGNVEVTAGKNGKESSTKFDASRMCVRAVIECTFVPLVAEGDKPVVGGTIKVFDDTHFEVLSESPPGDIVDVLGQVALRLMNVKASDMGKG